MASSIAWALQGTSVWAKPLENCMKPSRQGRAGCPLAPLKTSIKAELPPHSFGVGKRLPLPGNFRSGLGQPVRDASRLNCTEKNISKIGCPHGRCILVSASHQKKLSRRASPQQIPSIPPNTLSRIENPLPSCLVHRDGAIGQLACEICGLVGARGGT